MYTVKSKPEDFIVTEIPIDVELTTGNYAYCKLVKKDYNTSKAVEIVARHCKKSLRYIGFAGNKDRHAITTQYITIKDVSKEIVKSFSHKDITLEYLGQISHPLSLGDLKGNQFEIIARDCEKEPKAKDTFMNFFGSQRFSVNNADIGKEILLQNWPEVHKLLREAKMITEDVIDNDYLKVITQVPQKTLLLLVHAYQSKLWNECVSKITTITKNELPLLGFETEIEESPYKEILDAKLEEEGLNQRSFIVPQLKRLSVGGGFRKIIADVTDLTIEEIDSTTYKLTFSLGKGSYATEVVRQLFN